jgi:hypothetical protein
MNADSEWVSRLMLSARLGSSGTSAFILSYLRSSALESCFLDFLEPPAATSALPIADEVVEIRK